MNTILTVETISKNGSSEAIQARDGLMDVTMGQAEGCFPSTDGGCCRHLSGKLKPVTVLLADNRTIVRQGICALLALEKEISIIGQASDERQAAEMTERLHPDVVVINVALAFLDGMRATWRILEARPAPRVIILARHGDDTHVKHAVTLGAAGCLTEQTSAQMLVRAVHEAHQGGQVFDPGISGFLPAESKSRLGTTASRKPIIPLTARQRQILQLIAEGSANKQTAADLSISIKTVERHRQLLMAKLGIHETAGLTRYAIAAGIVECDFNAGAQPEEKPANLRSRQWRWLGRRAKAGAWKPIASVKQRRVGF